MHALAHELLRALELRRDLVVAALVHDAGEQRVPDRLRQRRQRPLQLRPARGGTLLDAFEVAVRQRDSDLPWLPVGEAAFLLWVLAALVLIWACIGITLRLT